MLPSLLPPALFLCQLLVLTFLLFFSGNTNSIFALDYISGALTLNGPLDRENPFYSSGFILTVKVRLLQLGRTLTEQDGEDILPGDRHPLPDNAANLGCDVLLGIQSHGVLTKGDVKHSLSLQDMK